MTTSLYLGLVVSTLISGRALGKMRAVVTISYRTG